MKCTTIKKLLIAYVYDDILHKDRELVEKHLASCPECSAELQNLQEAQLTLSYWQEQPVNKNLLHDTFLRTKPDIITPDELAVYLRVPVSDIMRNLENIPHFVIGKSIRFRRNTIHHWIKQIEYIPYGKKSVSSPVWVSPQNRIFDIQKS